MIKIENVVTPSPEQWEAIIMGTRNPMNSWDRSDSGIGCSVDFVDRICTECDRPTPCVMKQKVILGPNDHDLMMRLAKGGPVHAKYRRMITVYATITAPLYWWKEMDTYQIGVVKNSCSTMHKIAAKEFTLEDFSHEHLMSFDNSNYWEEDDDNACFIENKITSIKNTGITERYQVIVPMSMLENFIIPMLNMARQKFIETKDKKYWWQMIQLLPSSYNQKRTVMLNYEVLAGLYPMRKNHKLDEWREFCNWIETLPYSEIITGKSESEEIFKIGEALQKGMEKGLVDAWKKANPGVFVDEQLVSQEDVDELAKGWNDLVDKTWKEAFPTERESYPVDWTPPELEKLGIPYPATQEDIEKVMKIEHLVDVTCSWDTEAIINGDRLYEIGPDCTVEDLTPYERYLLDKTKSYQKNDTGV